MANQLDVLTTPNVRIVTYDTLEVLAAAVAAFKHNKGYYKQSEIIGEADGHPVYRHSNKDILRGQFLVDYFSSNAKPPVLTITDADRYQANDIREYTKKEIFNVLANQQTYATQLYECINKDTVSGADFGFVASAPFYYKNSKNKDYFKDRINNIQSKHVGTVGAKIYLENFEVIKNNKSVNYPGWVVMGICDGDLYLFFTRNEHIGRYEVGETVRIEGVIKDHVMEQNTIPMTKLFKVYESRILTAAPAQPNWGVAQAIAWGPDTTDDIGDIFK